ncbi:MAG: hypothetical protein ASARMPREDX12_005214 [Alectoria sarmentosa]|nr:MAG: hypothetical protein ASARMPREDX12_005214 [Alectoria sarmentosa]
MADANGPLSLADIPAAPPPPGVIPNYVNPYSEGPVLIIVGSIFVAIMLLFVSVRIYTKVKIVGKSSPDDYTCVIAAVRNALQGCRIIKTDALQIGAVGYFIIANFSVTVGHSGTHLWDLTLSDLSSKGFLLTGLFSDWVPNIIWPFAKLSFLLLYIQLFRPMKWLRYSAYAGVVVNVLFYTSMLALYLAFTIPHPGQTLQQSVQSSRQAHELAVALPRACVNFVLDVYILILPIAGISRLQLPIKKKLGVIAIFLTGLILIEMCVGVIASCMPSMSNLIHHLPKWTPLNSRLNSFFSDKLFSSTREKASSSQRSFSKPRKAEYADLDGPKPVFAERNYEMGPVKSTRTYIQVGSARELKEDGIHLQYKVEQESRER